MKSYPTPPVGMALKQPMCHITNLRKDPVTFVINAEISGNTFGSGSVIIRNVPTLSLGDKTVFAIEPQPDLIVQDGDHIRMEYR